MKKLYILLHPLSFIAGMYDGGDISFFVMLIVFDLCLLWDKLSSMNRKKVRR